MEREEDNGRLATGLARARSLDVEVRDGALEMDVRDERAGATVGWVTGLPGAGVGAPDTIDGAEDVEEGVEEVNRAADIDQEAKLPAALSADEA